MRVAIPGGTGLIGRELVRQLAAAGHSPVVLSRNPSAVARYDPTQEVARWDLGDREACRATLAACDALVNLAGEPIAAGRWTPARKARIRASRVDATRRIVELLAQLDPRPTVLIAASAVGYYGSRGDERLTEHAMPGDDFLAEVCRDVEAEASCAKQHGVRAVSLRTGIVLASEGGALARMRLPFKLGLGGRIGSGRQWWPWIHLADIAGIIVHALQDPAIGGAVNATAPEPVTNQVFTETLGRVLHRPARMPIPESLLRGIFGEMASVLVASQRVQPKKILAAGYTFAFPDLEDALDDCL